SITVYQKEGLINLRTKEGLYFGLYIGIIAGLFSGIVIGTITGFLNETNELTLLKVYIIGPIVGLIFGYGIRAFVGQMDELADNWAKREEKLW
ncbi:MAG: hypothetical protein KAR20_03055, partial [Candidatus Heimdallarchaeota archaeon]|nr:hypothetical protein [Candidatus Heimdallarchaeota archaeon]